ncbi:MAG TPA: hypothetical protein PKY82_19140 [Pyrinomonadaceae bacterium]|nr:hypothetical protein [Pyrinomonadaceae bacterium]
MKRKIKVTITKIQRIRVTEQKSRNRFFCQICQDLTEVVTIIETKEIYKLSEQTLNRLVSVAKIHPIQMPDVGLCFCKNSLVQIDLIKDFEMFWNFRH